MIDGETSSIESWLGVEGSGPETLFVLQIRVRWLNNPIVRWRFRAPQSASLVRVGRARTGSEEPRSTIAHTGMLSPMKKFSLIRETDERCYWCGRAIGSAVVLRRGLVRLRLHWDHVIPARVGGSGDADNMVPSCHLCNSWKSGRVFNLESEIREYLEAKWLAESPVEGAEESLSPAPIVVDESSAIVPAPAQSPRGKTSTITHTPKPETQAAPSGLPTNSRHLAMGKTVRIIDGCSRGRTGIVGGASHEREGWVRVLLGPQRVPWRFLPQQLAAVET